jgi:hypothetical protein
VVMGLVGAGLVIVLGTGEASAEAVSVCVSHEADINLIYRESRYIGNYFRIVGTDPMGSRQSAAWVTNIASWS